MERYQDFWDVTEAALRVAVTQLKIQASDAELHGLRQAYLRQSAFPDVTKALDALQGAPLAILSNGSPKMLASAVQHNGLHPILPKSFPLTELGRTSHLPESTCWRQVLGIPPEEILFVSSNSWDVAGAKSFGYKVCWRNVPRAQGTSRLLG